MAIYLLCAVIVVLEALHFIERRDLYSRIMCRDIAEYKNRSHSPKHIDSVHKQALKRWRDPKGGAKI